VKAPSSVTSYLGLVGLADDPERALGDSGDRDRDLGLRRRAGEHRGRDHRLSNEPDYPHERSLPVSLPGPHAMFERPPARRNRS
jgi:hypothetical protein